MCNGILLGPENNEIMPLAATWRLLYSVKLVKTKIMYHLYVESRKKMIQMNLFTKQIQTHRRRTQIYGYQGEGQIESLGLRHTHSYI